MAAFVDELLGAMPTPEAKLAATVVLARWRGATIYLPVHSNAERRVIEASKMLANGMNTRDVNNALRERFSISSRQASRDINAAKCLETAS